MNRVRGGPKNKPGEKVRVITEPSDFHEELCQRSACAKKRIVLASLYLGTGEKERRLLDCVEEGLQNSSDLRVKMLMDFSRGNRLVKGASSCTMLKPLLTKYPVSHQCIAHLHAPMNYRTICLASFPLLWPFCLHFGMGQNL